MARYRVVPHRSRLTAEARSSVHPIRVETTGLTGWFETEREGDRIAPGAASRGHVEIAVEQMKTGKGLYDREIERRLEARKYPRIVGTVQGLRPNGQGARYALESELRFHGVTRAVQAEVQLRFTDEKTLEIEGEHVFDMRHFDLAPPKILLLKVYPEVRIHCSVVAERED